MERLSPQQPPPPLRPPAFFGGLRADTAGKRTTAAAGSSSPPGIILTCLGGQSDSCRRSVFGDPGPPVGAGGWWAGSPVWAVCKWPSPRPCGDLRDPAGSRSGMILHMPGSPGGHLPV